MRSFGVIWSVAVDWTDSVRSKESSDNIQERFFFKLSDKRAINIIELSWALIGVGREDGDWRVCERSPCAVVST